MATVAIIAFAVLMIAVPAFLYNRDRIAGKSRGRRQRRKSTLPFLFFPTTGPTEHPPPVPAWPTHSGDWIEPEQPVRPEPGIADLPPQPEPGIADLPPRELSRRTERDRTVPFERADDERLETRD